MKRKYLFTSFFLAIDVFRSSLSVFSSKRIFRAWIAWAINVSSICNWHYFFSFFLVIFVIIYIRCCCCCCCFCWEPNHLWEFLDLFLSRCNPFICLCFCLVCINKYLNQYHHIYRPINFIFTTTCTDQMKSK